jgi:MFS family permease
MIVGMGMSLSTRESFVSLVTLMFSIPFVIFSMPGGWLADRFSKRQITIWTKVMEIGSMVVATAGLAVHSLPVSVLALGLVATQAALFGPTKYGLLPELLPAKRLSWGNGVIELGAFLAIIIGTVTGATMAQSFHGHEVYAGYALLALSFAGLLTSLGIDRVSPRRAGKEIPRQHCWRPLATDQIDVPRPAAVSFRCRKHLFLVPGLAAVFNHRCIRARRSSHRADQDRVSECHACRGHRHRQHGCRNGNRQQD